MIGDAFRRPVRLTLVFFVGSTFAPLAAAQQGEDEKTLQQDIAALKKDVKALGEKQQQILDQFERAHANSPVHSGPMQLRQLRSSQCCPN